jgi:hypothetical protein
MVDSRANFYQTVYWVVNWWILCDKVAIKKSKLNIRTDFVDILIEQKSTSIIKLSWIRRDLEFTLSVKNEVQSVKCVLFDLVSFGRSALVILNYFLFQQPN